jgi:hypothetical protein
MVDKPASPWYYAGAAGGITNTTAVVVTPAAVSGQRYFLTNLQFQNSAAVASEMVIRNTTGSVVLWRGYVNASMTSAGWFTFDPPLQSLANDTLEVVLLTNATATRVSAQGFLDA